MNIEDLSVENGGVQRSPPYAECKICHRYFGSSSINVHEKKCAAKHLREEEASEAETRHQNRVITRMPGVLCYICKRPFGRAGMVFHEKQCLAKWRRMNAELPKSERQPEPQKPQKPMRPGMYNNQDVLNSVNEPMQLLNVNNNPLPPRLVTSTCKPRINKRVLRRPPRRASASPSVKFSNATQIFRMTDTNASPSSPSVARPRGNSLHPGNPSSNVTTTSGSKWLAPSM